MGDSKQQADNELLGLDDVTDNENLSLEGDDFGDFEDFEDAVEEAADTNEEAQSVKGAEEKKGGERLWVILTVVSFVAALLLALLLMPAVTVQKQRAAKVANLTVSTNAVTQSAARALTPSGSYTAVETDMGRAEDAMNALIASGGTSNKVADMLFGNAAANADVNEKWTAFKANVDRFNANKADVDAVKKDVRDASTAMSQAFTESVSFVNAVAVEGRNKNSGTAKDRYLYLTSEASDMNGLQSTMIANLQNFFTAQGNLQQSSDRLSSFMTRLQESLNRIVSNSATVVSTAAEPLRGRYSEVESKLTSIGDRVSAVSESRATLRQMSQSNRSLFEASSRASNQGSVDLMSMLSTLLPLLLALFGAFCLWRYSRVKGSGSAAADSALEDTLAEQQESILKLLDEMSALADGDLTVEAEVTDQITGAIADSVNFAVIEMRELVSQINRASIEVANESELAVSNAQSVSQSNASQAEAITKAAGLMQQVSQSMREMSQQASSSSSMAGESMKVAERGAQAVRDTIQGMEDMREQIQETSKRIKRLGESSQRIGDIVALIDDIAEQTNILSLNAAIQASMAGEAGRGFAVVSDEVQSLAERSTEATKKIAELVSTIQNDTNDAVLSMEKATQQVVSGTKVADTAGTALSEIENVSKSLSELVEKISKGSNEQADKVSTVTEQVTDVSDSSTETSRKAQESANSIAKLLELAKDLETSVSRFKLPAS